MAAEVERVPRKAIRPCPPPINGTDDWVSGDVVEVFDELCWKPAVIVRVFGGNNFSVRILGSNSELKADQSRLRVRQSWEDGNWFLVGKVIFLIPLFFLKKKISNFLYLFIFIRIDSYLIIIFDNRVRQIPLDRQREKNLRLVSRMSVGRRRG